MSLRNVNYFVGFDAAVWFALIGRYRKFIGRSQWPTVAVLSGFSVLNSCLKWIERGLVGRRIADVALPPSPIVILGHWRCGTTLLHEFFACDRRCAYPTSYQCFAPHHCLLTERLLSGALSGVLEWAMGGRPTRPQDTMESGYARPQEDEFALTFLGAGSPYLGLLFPSQGRDFLRYRTLDELTESERHRWKVLWVGFLKKVMLNATGQHLVLKSPIHTFRIPTVLDVFPAAKFVHILRDPYVVFPSTVHTFTSMARYGVLESEDATNWQEWVFEMGDSLYATLAQTRHRIPPGHLVEIRYEDLVTHPVEIMRRLYRHLDLDQFETMARPGLERYLQRVSDYRPNQYHVPVELRDEIRRRWRQMLDHYDSISGGGVVAS